MNYIHTENRAELFAALAKAQAELKPADLDGKNPHFNSTFSTLLSVVSAFRSVFAKHNLSVTQFLESSGNDKITVTTTVMHSAGGYMMSSLTLSPERATPQGAGSAITYARRYALAAIAGVVSDEDDDGNEASTPRPVATATTATNQPDIGVSNESYVIPFGKYKGKRLAEVAPDALAGYLSWMEQGGMTDPKKMHPATKDFLFRAEKFLGDIEKNEQDAP